MKKIFLSLLLLRFAFFCAAASSFAFSLDKAAIYEGEHISASVRVGDIRRDCSVPEFGHMGKCHVEYLGSSDESRHSTIYVNGRKKETSERARTFRYRIKPLAAGNVYLGDISFVRDGETISGKSAYVSVKSVRPRDDAAISLKTRRPAATLFVPFDVILEIRIKSPMPGVDAEPLVSDNPLHIMGDFLDFAQMPGLKAPSPDEALSKYLSRDSLPGFKINGYSRPSLSPFDYSDRDEIFRLKASRQRENGTDWWIYEAVFTFVPEIEGEYGFGPVTLRGPIWTDGGGQGTVDAQNIFIRSEKLTVKALSPPKEHRPVDFCGGIGSGIVAKASLDTVKCNVGDPVVLSVDLTGCLNPGRLLAPKIEKQREIAECFRVYPGSAEAETLEDGKRFKYRIRPLKAGTLEVPPIKVSYYDPDKGEYLSVSTKAIPLESAPAELIAASPSQDAGGEIFVPDGIFSGLGKDTAPYAFAGGIAVWLGPALSFFVFLFSRSLRLFSKRREEGKYARAMRSAYRKFSREISSRKQPDEKAVCAMAHLRAFAAARLNVDSPGLTYGDIAEKSRDGRFGLSFSARFLDLYRRLEEYAYAGDPAKTGERGDLLHDIRGEMDSLLGQGRTKRARKRNSGVLLLVLFALVFSIGQASAALPSPFDWERAQRAMERAKTEEEFLDAAECYGKMAVSGALCGELFSNMAMASLLGGNPQAALEAAQMASLWFSSDEPEIANATRAARHRIGLSGDMPGAYYLFPWHYRLNLRNRICCFLVFWNLFWIAVVLRQILPGTGAKKALWRISAWMCICAMLFLGSLAYTEAKIRAYPSSPIDLSVVRDIQSGK